MDESGLITLGANYSVDETVKRLLAMLGERGIEVFAVIDHSGGAEKAGLEMPPTKLVIFGNPRAGTPLMLASPTCAIDLPLKLLIWQDDQAQVWVTYNSPEYVMQRHRVPTDMTPNIAAIDDLAHATAGHT